MSSDSMEAPKPEVRYVLSGQPTGWAAMGKEVREFDEEKVKNSKEDIDTLLVFAGLFSAVLSAFLVAAYPSLQADRMDTIVYTLQVIATQTAGYNLIGNTITSSTAALPSLPTFKPTPNDIRVNVLWFASLVVSLITASFAMLVKQWLREFLAVEVPSPQARLRIRHFRESQLKEWMVYEIAASLPLLLQLSLALFFLGLCYFTAGIHASIGYTTLPLVVGWALFFFVAAALPIFFPRCPYRTTFLKALVARLHRRVNCLIVWAKVKANPHPESRPAPSSSLNRLYRAWCSCSGLFKSALRYMLPTKSLPDEREIVKAKNHDIDILISVDRTLANDELMLGPIIEALLYRQPYWVDAVHFVMQILEHRLLAFTIMKPDRMLVEWPFPDAFPLTNGSLRPQVIEGIIKVLSECAKQATSPYVPIFRDSNRRNECLYEFEVIATRPRAFLCMFSLIIAVTKASPHGVKSITSNPGLLNFLCKQFGDPLYQRLPELCLDWISVAVGRRLIEGRSRHLTTMRCQARGDLLFFIADLVKPAKMSLHNGVEFIEALTGKSMQTWGETNVFEDWVSGSSASELEAYMQSLLHNDFQHRASIESRTTRSTVDDSSSDPPVSPDETARVLNVLLHSMRREGSIEHPHSLLWLSRIVDVASYSYSCADYLITVLLGGGGPHSPSNSIALAGYFTGGPPSVVREDIVSEYPDITDQGVLNFKSVILARSTRISDNVNTLLPLLQLCQVAMTLFCLVNIPFNGRGAVREIFASLDISLRSNANVTESSSVIASAKDPQHRSSTKETGEIAHACLLTMMLYQQNRYFYYEKDGPTFSEPDSIFPDDLVEILMELDTTESYKSLRFFRIRRIAELCLPGLEQIRDLWPDLPEPGVTPAVETTPIVNGEGIENGPDTGSRGHYNVDGPSNNFTDIHAHEGTARVTANKDSGDDVEHFGPSNVNPSPDVDGHTDVHPSVSPHAYEDGVHEGEAAESVEDDTPSTTRSDRQDNPVAQHNQTPTALDMGLADAVEREETRLLLADIYEHEGTARTTVNEDSKDNVDHPNFSNANNSPDRGSQIGADLAAASPHVPGDATLEHEPAQPADNTFGTTTQARPDDKDGQVAQHGSVSETSSVGANDTAERVEG